MTESNRANQHGSAEEEEQTRRTGAFSPAARGREEGGEEAYHFGGGGREGSGSCGGSGVEKVRARIYSARGGSGQVHQTVGNWSGLAGYRSNRSGPVPVLSGMKPVQIQNLNLNSKK